jgi:transcriptional regulator with XRE-family HTH domain
MPNTYQKVDQSRSRKLIAYLHAINIEQKLVAEILGVTQATVSRKMSGASPGFYNKEIDTLEGYLGIVFESQLELEGVILLRKSDDLALEKVGRL